MKLVFAFVFITLLAASYELQSPVTSLLDRILIKNLFNGVRVPKNSHTHSYMVALIQSDIIVGEVIRGVFCGGSLISQRTVLTAAHCIARAYRNGALMSSLRGNVGTLRWDEGGTLYSFSRNVTYPHYVPSTIRQDLGLLITTIDVVLSRTVTILPMNFNFQGTDVPVTVAGWGRYFKGGPSSDHLLMINTTTIDANRCVEDAKAATIALKIRVPLVEPDIHLCTYHKPDHGVCKGDSGSPLVRIEDGQQVGIVSWGFPCALGAPDVFVRISAYKEWIQKNMV